MATTEIKTPEDLQKFLDGQNLRMSAILEGYELSKAKLAKAQQDYSALAQMYNEIVEENKRLKEELNGKKETAADIEILSSPAPKRKRSAKK